jgi:hypothetical protein
MRVIGKLCLARSMWVACLLAAGCSGDSAPTAPFAGRPNDGAAGGGDGSDVSNREGALDRCLGTSCNDPAYLPPQPDVPFLGDAGDGWLRLVEADWELQPESEGYRCVDLTVPYAVYVTAFLPLNPSGTHHTTLTVSRSPQRPDGVTACGVDASGDRRLQGAGAGTAASQMPDGVAMKIAAGEQLRMNLHLFNIGKSVLRGTSGMRVKVTPKEQVQSEAEVRLVGPLNLTIPRGQVVQTGKCTFQNMATVFSVVPHMHQLGVHAKIVAHSSLAGDKVLFDGAYDFTHQYVYPVDEFVMAAGDNVSVECTYLNTTDETVMWGDSSLAEMCFAGVGVYPSVDSGGIPCSE